MISFLMCFLYLSAIRNADSGEIDFKYYHVKYPAQYDYQVGKGDKVELKIYYESLCPDCVKFYTGPLNDTYKEIGSHINLKTYPYGKAETKEENGKTVITCQHGEAECYGNKLHACAIDILKNVSQSVVYNSCMMLGQWGGWGSTDMDATNCGQSMGIDAEPIIGCAKSQRGEDLLEYYGRETDNDVPDKTSVPWVLLNGELFDTEHDDLMKKICEALSNPPQPCLKKYQCN